VSIPTTGTWSDTGQTGPDRHVESADHQQRKTVKSREQRRSKRIGNDHGSLRCQTLKTKTLRVPAGWNKPASYCGRLTCREVAKTCGWVAIQVDPVSVTSGDEGAERDQT